MDWYKLPSFRITDQFPVEKEDFINQQYQEMEQLRDLGNQLNEFTEKALFKEIIQDVDYVPILDGLAIMESTDIIEQAKV